MASEPGALLDLEDVVARVSTELRSLVSLLGSVRPVSAEEIAAVESVGRLADAARVLVARPLVSDPAALDAVGGSSLVGALASIAQVSERTARERIAVARAIAPHLTLSGSPVPPPCPVLAEALVGGEIGADAAVLVVRQLDSIAPRVERDALGVAEQMMVNLATGFDPMREQALPAVSVDYLAPQLKILAAALDPDGARPREERAERRRSLRIGREDDDGLFPVRGLVKREIVLLLRAAYEAFRRSPRFVDTALGREEPSADTRSPEKLLHDVLGELVIAATSHDGTPQLNGAPVTVVVMVNEADLANEHGLIGDPIGEMVGSTVPVSRGQVERFIDAGGFRRVIKNNEGAVAGIGLPERCFTYPQRLAVAARDGYSCFTPGCTAPHYTLQVHHVKPDREGGPTAVDNAILLCYWCHSRVDTGPWHYRMVGGVPEVRGPGYPEWTRPRRAVGRAA